MSDKKGKESGVTSDDIAKAPDVGRVTPGKTTLQPTTEVGDPWIDHGAVCDGKDTATSGCLFTDWQRLKLIVDIKARVETAATNYKFALVELKMSELLKKEDDLPWVLSLALDMVGSHFIKVLGKAAVALKGAGVQKLASSMDGAYMNDRSWRARGEQLLGALDDKAIETHVKATFDPVKKAGVAGAKSEFHDPDKRERNRTVAYIDQLKDQCDVGFQTFTERVTATSNDAELLVVREGLDRANHSIGAYKVALGEKIARFKKSGVTELGRHVAIVDRFPHGTRVRDKRVIWYHEDGKRTLRYQTQDSAFLTQSMNAGKFGPNYAEPSQVGDQVPDEFVDVALARSEQLWGPTPSLFGRSASAPTFNPAAPATPPKPATPTPMVPTQVPRRGPKSVEPDMDSLPDAFNQVKVK
jgi:hypothetical protein